MTGIARNILVPALQGEFSILVMIEDQLLPLLAGMAFLALLTVPAIVGIVDQMAADTLFRGVFIVLASVTQLTVQFLVLADQLVFRIDIVIEFLLLPALFTVALIALLTEFSLVRVVGLVTIEAYRGGLTVFLQFLSVAESAGSRPMRTL